MCKDLHNVFLDQNGQGKFLSKFRIAILKNLKGTRVRLHNHYFLQFLSEIFVLTETLIIYYFNANHLKTKQNNWL